MINDRSLALTKEDKLVFRFYNKAHIIFIIVIIILLLVLNKLT